MQHIIALAPGEDCDRRCSGLCVGRYVRTCNFIIILDRDPDLDSTIYLIILHDDDNDVD